MKKLSTPIFTGLALAAAFSAQAETRAVIDTNMGKIELALDEKKPRKPWPTSATMPIKAFTTARFSTV